MVRSFWQLITQYKVVIPKIQRDYAQGRTSGKAPEIRENLLNALFGALQKEEVLELDFIYGYTKENKGDTSDILDSFYPLDGQQRLTTLYLLHWYIAQKEGKMAEAAEFLKRFTYDVRISSRNFCNALVSRNIKSEEQKISEAITDEPWFFAAWKNDPTIQSMLVMLDTIESKYCNYEGKDVWGKLTSDNPMIVFHLLRTDELGMPDDLYIKMNSRGKELTDFEYFKIKFLELLDGEHARIFPRRMDQKWSDFIWKVFKESESDDIALEVDKGFLRLFNYLTDMLESKMNEKIENEEIFTRYSRVYANRDNTDSLFKILDVLSDYSDLPAFFKGCFYTRTEEYTNEKTRIYFVNADENLLKKCMKSYNADLRVNPFSMGEQILLYACIIQMRSPVTDFPEKLRKIRNYVVNSEDTLRREYIGSFLRSVEEVLSSGNLPTETKINRSQMLEESKKVEFLMIYPDYKNKLYYLEDHPLLQGSISIMNFSEQFENRVETFYEIFHEKCDYLQISRALMTFGDYSQTIKNRKVFGNRKDPAWREILTKNERRGGFENTSTVLMELLDKVSTMAPTDLSVLIDEYLKIFEKDKNKEKDFRYYYIKYDGFRCFSDGYYFWKDYEKKPYEMMMLNKTNLIGKHWCPFLYTLMLKKKDNCALLSYGEPLNFSANKGIFDITNMNEGFSFTAKNSEGKVFLDKLKDRNILTEEYQLSIEQSNKGKDLEDRIEKLEHLLDLMLNHNEVEEWATLDL